MTISSTAERRPSVARSAWAAMAMSVAVLVAAVVGLFTQTETAEALVYSYAFEAGDMRTYAMSMRVTLTPQGIPGATGPLTETVKARMSMKVLDVEDDGSMTIELKLSDASIAGDSGFQALSDYQNATVKMRVSETGEVLSVDGSSFLGFDPTEFLGRSTGKRGSTVGSNNLFPVFPSDAIGPGDTWTESDDYPIPFGKQTVHVDIRGKHLGFVESKYGRAARMNVKADTPLDLSIAFMDILKAAGQAVPTDEVPAEFDKARMVLDGITNADMTAQILPNGGDLVKMVMLMKMNVAMKFEGFPQDVSAEMPSNFRMVGDIVMKLDRVA